MVRVNVLGLTSPALLRVSLVSVLMAAYYASSFAWGSRSHGWLLRNRMNADIAHGRGGVSSSNECSPWPLLPSLQSPSRT